MIWPLNQSEICPNHQGLAIHIFTVGRFELKYSLFQLTMCLKIWWRNVVHLSMGFNRLSLGGLGEAPNGGGYARFVGLCGPPVVVIVYFNYSCCGCSDTPNR